MVRIKLFAHILGCWNTSANVNVLIFPLLANRLASGLACVGLQLLLTKSDVQMENAGDISSYLSKLQHTVTYWVAMVYWIIHQLMRWNDLGELILCFLCFCLPFIFVHLKGLQTEKAQSRHQMELLSGVEPSLQ